MFFLSSFWSYKHIIYLILWFGQFEDLLEKIFKKYSCASLFLLIFVVKFLFAKSVESISFLKKRPASDGIYFFSIIF